MKKLIPSKTVAETGLAVVGLAMFYLLIRILAQ
jgi:hypothetical protein